MKKKVFIPGWMDTVKNRVDFEGIDIWKENLPLSQKIEAEYIIGHSVGANYALINWQLNKNSKFILVGPAIPKRNIFVWLYRLIKFWIFEGTTMSKERIKSFKYFFQSIPKIVKLLNTDLMAIIYKMPKENLVVIRGANDKFMFDQETADDLKSRGIKVIEIEGVGHNWNEKIEEEVSKIVESN